VPAEVLRCDGEKMKRRLRSAAEQDAMMVLRKKIGVEEAKAAILGDLGYGAAEGPSEMHGVTRPLGNVWGDLVLSRWEKGRRARKDRPGTATSMRGKRSREPSACIQTAGRFSRREVSAASAEVSAEERAAGAAPAMAHVSVSSRESPRRTVEDDDEFGMRFLSPQLLQATHNQSAREVTPA
jgi:hypothetical protein